MMLQITIVGSIRSFMRSNIPLRAAQRRPEAFYRGISDQVIAMDGYIFR